jgi:hypothetical protein
MVKPVGRVGVGAPVWRTTEGRMCTKKIIAGDVVEFEGTVIDVAGV